MTLTDKEYIDLVKLKSLLNHLSYIIKPEHEEVVESFHLFLRKLCDTKEPRLTLDVKKWQEEFV